MTKDKSIVIKNIYYMLTYAFQVLNQSNYDEIASEKFENIHDLFAAILSKGIAQQLKQGLHREYIEKNENLTVMRGKLDIQGTIVNRLQKQQRLSCNFDELSEDSIYNQIIKTTTQLLIRKTAVKSEYKDILKKEMLFFEGVSEIDPMLIRWNMILFTKNNQTYRMLLSICQFVLSGLLLTTEQGEYKLAEFVDDQRMSHLYERFILEYYRKEYPMITANASQIDWQTDDGITTLLPIMQTDIMLSYKGKTLIIDAKYYTHTMQTITQYNSQTLHSHNLYQIFTYVKNKDTENSGKVSGLLLYARTDESVQPDNEYMMSGNKISVKTLDLNCDFDIIKLQLSKIADPLLVE